MMMLGQLAPALLALVLPLLVQGEELRQLTSDTFESSIARGQWLVEHYSPNCGHCRAFAPTWEKLAGENKWREEATGFHMAQVNCMAQGDLCASNGVTGYPSIKLYQDGKLVTSYAQSRDANVVQAFITVHSTEYSKRRPDGSQSANGELHLGSGGDGTVVKLDRAGLDRVKREGGFVKYFVPWCGHCKKLAPVFAELAQKLRGQVPLYEVDCEADKAVCRAEGVPGYPQLILYANGQKYEHTGGRSLNALTKFAEKALTTGSAETINVEDLKKIAQQEEVFFVYLHTHAAPPSDLALVTKASQSLLGSALIYQSQDLDLFSYTGVLPTSGSALLCIKDHQARTPIASLSFSADHALTQADVSRFIEENKLPTVVELDAGNFREVMKNTRGSIVILAGLTTTDEHKLRDNVALLRDIATAWRKGGRQFEQGVIFAWMDGNKWGKWLKQNYGMSRSAMPQVVVADPIKSEYYDVTLEIEKLELKGHSIFSTLEGVFQKTLKPKTVESWPDRLSRAMSIKFGEWRADASEYPLRLAAGGFLLVIVAVWVLKKLLTFEFSQEQQSKEPSRLD